MADVVFDFTEERVAAVPEEDVFFLAVWVRERCGRRGGTTAGRVLASQLELAATIPWRKLERMRLTRLQSQLVLEALDDMPESEAFGLSPALHRLADYVRVG
jgi:hypothetical protein